MPDPVEIQKAEQACKTFYSLNEDSQIVLSSGAQPLLFALAAKMFQQYGASRIAILSPTYSEYERIWGASGHHIALCDGLANLDESAAAAIICSPNNPDGNIISFNFLQELMQTRKSIKLWVIDGAFADIAPEAEYVRLLDQFPHTVILRSFGKFFGLGGMRISAALCHGLIAEYLRVCVGPWPISTQACALLPNMLADIKWRTDTLNRLKIEATQWRKILGEYFKIIGYTDLFTLVSTPKTERLHNALAEQGVVTRIFTHHKEQMRFGLPGADHLPRIKSALRIAMKDAN